MLFVNWTAFCTDQQLESILSSDGLRNISYLSAYRRLVGQTNLNWPINSVCVHADCGNACSCCSWPDDNFLMCCVYSIGRRSSPLEKGASDHSGPLLIACIIFRHQRKKVILAFHFGWPFGEWSLSFFAHADDDLCLHHARVLCEFAYFPRKSTNEWGCIPITPHHAHSLLSCHGISLSGNCKPNELLGLCESAPCAVGVTGPSTSFSECPGKLRYCVCVCDVVVCVCDRDK